MKTIEQLVRHFQNALDADQLRRLREQGFLSEATNREDDNEDWFDWREHEKNNAQALSDEMLEARLTMTYPKKDDRPRAGHWKRLSPSLVRAANQSPRGSA
ncbi:hypothetical protein [Zavarzinella formosa]|uniref:hypothetical protein n=1 Tax=Zavarzinella formosa TaxID=360055 RepID=UPI0003170097|nr:hypothetical protein [Zavarzinella formosa]